MPKRQIFTVTQVLAVKHKPYAIYEARIWASGAPEAIRRARLGLAPSWRLVDRWGSALSTFLHYTCDDAYELYDESASRSLP